MSPKYVSTSVRGIGVALSTSTSTASPLLVSARRSRTPKRCCSSTTASASALKMTSSWISAWVPTRKIDLAGFQPRQDLAPLLALFAAGQDRHAKPGAFGQRGDGLDVLAREDFGRRHQRGLLAGLDDGGRGQQRHHRLAGSDIALQQPQHPHRLAQILGNGRNRLALRRGQRIGQRVDDPVAQMAVAGVAVAGRAPQLRAHQRQRQLAGEQFVERKPRPERAIGQNVGEFDRDMHPVQRLADRRKAAAAHALPD